MENFLSLNPPPREPVSNSKQIHNKFSKSDWSIDIITRETAKMASQGHIHGVRERPVQNSIQ